MVCKIVFRPNMKDGTPRKGRSERRDRHWEDMSPQNERSIVGACRSRKYLSNLMTFLLQTSLSFVKRLLLILC